MALERAIRLDPHTPTHYVRLNLLTIGLYFSREYEAVVQAAKRAIRLNPSVPQPYRWLAAHPNVTFHFTPTSASWLNQVEIWFGIFTRKALSGASFRSAEQLKQAIHAYDQRAAPFVWRKREVKGSQLRYTIVNLRN